MNKFLRYWTRSSGNFVFITFFIWLLLTPPSAHAAAFSTGDVFVAVSTPTDIFSPGVIEHYDKDLQFLGTLEPTGITGVLITHAGMAFDQAGNLYVTNRSDQLESIGGGRNSISRYNNEGMLLQPNPFALADEASGVESIVFDADGNFFVGQAGGFAGIAKTEVIKYGPDGTRGPSFPVEVEFSGSDAIDLAADQLTLFYTSEGRLIKRFNLGNGTQLSDFAILPGVGLEAFALRLLGDGGLLVADTENIKRLNTLGEIIQTYDAPNEDTWFSLNLDPNGTSFWSAGFGLGSQFYKFNIETGEVELSRGIETIGGSILGTTVFEERTVAVPAPPSDPGPGNSPIPEPGTVLLLGSGLLGMGLWHWKEQRKNS